MNTKILCVWEGTTIPEEQKGADFENFFKTDFDVRVKFADVFLTLPDFRDGRIVEGTGGRSDLLFWIDGEDVHKFALRRFAIGVRWWEDYASVINGFRSSIPQEILDKYAEEFSHNSTFDEVVDESEDDDRV